MLYGVHYGPQYLSAGGGGRIPRGAFGQINARNWMLSSSDSDSTLLSDPKSLPALSFSSLIGKVRKLGLTSGFQISFSLNNLVRESCRRKNTVEADKRGAACCGGREGGGILSQPPPHPVPPLLPHFLAAPQRSPWARGGGGGAGIPPLRHRRSFSVFLEKQCK